MNELINRSSQIFLKQSDDFILKEKDDVKTLLSNKNSIIYDSNKSVFLKGYENNVESISKSISES